MTIRYTYCDHIGDLDSIWPPWLDQELTCDSKCPSCLNNGILGLLLDARGWLDEEPEREDDLERFYHSHHKKNKSD